MWLRCVLFAALLMLPAVAQVTTLYRSAGQLGPVQVVLFYRQQAPKAKRTVQVELRAEGQRALLSASQWRQTAGWLQSAGQGRAGSVAVVQGPGATALVVGNTTVALSPGDIRYGGPTFQRVEQALRKYHP
jgi:hypothetical protein